MTSELRAASVEEEAFAKELAERPESVQGVSPPTFAGLDADLPHQEFESAHRSAEEARAIFERTREELLQHVFVHGCQQSPE